MKILQVDDDPYILDAVTVGFELQWPGCQIITSQTGDQGLQAFAEHNPDLVVLDVSLPRMNGFDVLRELRRASDVPVILLTSRGSEVDQVRGLELGADDYVIKPFSHLALLARVKAILRRAELPPMRELPDFVAGDLTVNFRHQRVTLRGELVKLTPVEYKLLYHLVRSVDRVVPHQVLLDRVWGAQHFTSPSYLKVFISRLRAKIEPEGGPRYIENIRGLGYRLVRQPQKKVTGPDEDIDVGDATFGSGSKNHVPEAMALPWVP